MKKKTKKNLFSTKNIDRTIHEIIKIASLFLGKLPVGPKGHQC